MVVDEVLIVEGKSTFHLRKDALRQLYSYLHGTDFEVGLFLHFGPEPRFYRMVSMSSPRESA